MEDRNYELKEIIRGFPIQKSIKLAIPAIDKNQITLRKIITENFSFQSFGGYHRNGLGSSIQIDYLQHPLAAYKKYSEIIQASYQKVAIISYF